MTKRASTWIAGGLGVVIVAVAGYTIWRSTRKPSEIDVVAKAGGHKKSDLCAGLRFSPLPPNIVAAMGC